MSEQPSHRRALAELPTDPELFAASFGEALRHSRQRRGWTQAELADAAGISPNYVARLERGELSPSLFVAVRLATALEMSVEGLLAKPPSPQRSTKRRI
ncbi:MAG: helix-turn-helix transcriptional regulator [Polyangiaceae bacterium]|nr:helix-turn-helix transcriptional regulator [Polyangiaceae bacterium]